MSGEIVTGSELRQCVKRHLEDLEHAGDRGFYFDPEIASRAVAFFPMCLRHSIGEFAGRPFELTACQKFIVWTLFGWRRSSDKRRRFSYAYITVARKFGKSEFAAGIALMLTLFDEPLEPAAEVYTVATKRDQAAIVFRQACRMVARSEHLQQHCEVKRAAITVPDRSDYLQPGSTLQPQSSDGKTLDGLNIHGAILDELHAWSDYHQDTYDKVTTGSGSRTQALVLVITTAGDDRSRIWQRVDSLAVQICSAVETGDIVADHVFCFVARMDAGDDVLDERNWLKANPNLPITPRMEYLREQAKVAATDPIELNKFTRFHANMKVTSTEQAIGDSEWRKCKGELPELAELECFGGVDIGRSDDFAAFGLVWPLEDECYAVKAWSFTCEERSKELASRKFQKFIDEGDLIVNSGNQIDFEQVRRFIVEKCDEYNVTSVGYDPTFAAHLAQVLLNENGIQMIKQPQIARYYNEPIRKFRKSVINGRVVHDGGSCLNWQVHNLIVKRNSNDEWMPDKSSKELKIDAAVAILMGVRESLFSQTSRIGTFYEDNDIEVL